MLKKTIKYKDFNGDEQEEDFYFHLSKADLVKLELRHKGGLRDALQRIVDAEDGQSIMVEFENILEMTYGKKSSDGKRFIKNKELWDEFRSTNAYDKIFMELVTDTDLATKFIVGVAPEGLITEAEIAAEVARTTPKSADLEKPAPRVITKAELIAADGQAYVDLVEKIGSGEVILLGQDEVKLEKE
jgi:hypothetical protein